MKTAEEVAKDCQSAYSIWFNEQLKKPSTGRLMKDIMDEGEKYAFDYYVSAIKEYAESCIKEHLSRAAENARAYIEHEYHVAYAEIDRESITNIDIVLP